MRIKRIQNKDIDPDEIFLDSSNLSSLDLQQFEGRIEKPISKLVFVFTGFFFLLIFSAFMIKAWRIQVTSGPAYLERSESNSLKHIPALPDRGVIYDRNDDLLAWNKDNYRVYKKIDGIAHIIGYLGYPSKEEAENGDLVDMKELVGKGGVEKSVNSLLRGKEGTRIVEVDARGSIQSENVYSPGIKGLDVHLSIDDRLSEKMFQEIKNLAIEKNFSGGSGVLMDVNSGEIIFMVSYPEYDLEALSYGKDNEKISSYLNDKNMPFLNRAISGLYIPGSVIKPVFALGALNEGVIDPKKEILSTGSISIPNPYFPDKPTVFKDWKAHGWVDMRQAIAVSSDVYFYTIGGGHEGQKGLGIYNLEKYARMFGYGSTTGIDLSSEAEGNIPSPEWKSENFNGEKWSLGNTYHSAIGQYGFQATPLQVVRSISAIANDGKLIRPTIFKMDAGVASYVPINISKDKFKIAKEGMRLSVTEGTSQGLNLPYVEVAGKTGTAELGAAKKYVNAWSVGFFPYENPKYAFAVVMEKGPVANTVGGVYVMRQFFDWLYVNAPEYLK